MMAYDFGVYDLSECTYGQLQMICYTFTHTHDAMQELRESFFYYVCCTWDQEREHDTKKMKYSVEEKLVALFNIDL